MTITIQQTTGKTVLHGVTSHLHQKIVEWFHTEDEILRITTDPGQEIYIARRHVVQIEVTP